MLLPSLLFGFLHYDPMTYGPNAVAIAVWKIPATGDNIKRSRRFNILSSILSDRMREEIREKLGGSYSPRAGSAPSQELDFGMLRAMAQVKPEETKKYGELMIKLADIMAEKGVTKDELRGLLHIISIYAGVPAGVSSFRIAKKVFAEEGM